MFFGWQFKNKIPTWVHWRYFKLISSTFKRVNRLSGNLVKQISTQEVAAQPLKSKNANDGSGAQG